MSSLMLVAAILFYFIFDKNSINIDKMSKICYNIDIKKVRMVKEK